MIESISFFWIEKSTVDVGRQRQIVMEEEEEEEEEEEQRCSRPIGKA